MKRVIRSTVVCTTLLIIFTGCGDAPATVESISNAKSLSVTAQQESSMTKVVALANGSAEIVSALGYRKILVGRDIATSSRDGVVRHVGVGRVQHQISRPIRVLREHIVLDIGSADVIDIKRVSLEL